MQLKPSPSQFSSLHLTLTSTPFQINCTPHHIPNTPLDPTSLKSLLSALNPTIIPTLLTLLRSPKFPLYARIFRNFPESNDTSIEQNVKKLVTIVGMVCGAGYGVEPLNQFADAVNEATGGKVDAVVWISEMYHHNVINDGGGLLGNGVREGGGVGGGGERVEFEGGMVESDGTEGGKKSRNLIPPVETPSESFTLRDTESETYPYHYPPLPTDMFAESPTMHDPAARTVPDCTSVEYTHLIDLLRKERIAKEAAEDKESSLRQYLSQANTTLHSHQSEIHALRNLNAVLERTTKEVETKLSIAHDEKHALSLQLTEWEGELRTLKELQTQHLSVKAENQVAIYGLDSMRKRNVELEGRVKDLEEELGLSESRVSKHREDAERKRETIRSLQSAKQELEVELKEAIDQIHGLNKQTEKVRDDVRYIRVQSKKLKQSIATTQQHTTNTDSDINQLRCKLRDEQFRNSILQQKNTSLEAKLDLQDGNLEQIKDLTGEVHRLRDHIFMNGIRKPDEVMPSVVPPYLQHSTSPPRAHTTPITPPTTPYHPERYQSSSSLHPITPPITPYGVDHMSPFRPIIGEANSEMDQAEPASADQIGDGDGVMGGASSYGQDDMDTRMDEAEVGWV
ncbi:hypothetical protein HK097_010281 [Rhizophlyctis rosea]|uniref:Uncharacterized protein n=1 Tax=Rhizophlyctis rosea TaxID=64517 RepID=A0AAD5SPC7_9FUNG|nr:hypothetical protein HK097_010281 [Rhizophlyctis rosea]